MGACEPERANKDPPVPIFRSIEFSALSYEPFEFQPIKIWLYYFRPLAVRFLGVPQSGSFYGKIVYVDKMRQIKSNNI